MAKSLPTVLARFLSSGGLVPPTIATQQVELASSEQPKDTGVDLPSTSRGDRFFSENKKTKVSAELLDLTMKAFSKALSVEKWKELIDSYPPIEGADSILIAPTMEAGMKEDLRNRHGYQKTKEVLAFDEGLSEKQASYICVARPILSALSALDTISEDGEPDGPDPDTIKAMLEDALAMLGNANARLNGWRQRRFSEFLTEIGKRTLREGIPTDSHLFPHKFHERIRSEHDHSASNKKIISQPKEPRPRFNRPQPFYNSGPSRGPSQNTSSKRRWSFHNKRTGFNKKAKTGERSSPPSGSNNS